AAVQGAMYDALRAHAAAALGRPAPQEPESAGPANAAEENGPLRVWQESTRHWLMELALAGFRQGKHSTLAPFGAALEQLQGHPRASRLAALLTGFLGGLLQALPITAMPKVPICRWVDLWTGAMIGSLRAPLPPSGQKVSGGLTVLGVDLRHHGCFVSFD